MKQHYYIFSLLVLLAACGSKPIQRQTVSVVSNVNVPAFSPDSAYKYIENQVNFGARVPNTKAHLACADYLSNTLSYFGTTVYTQKVKLTAFNGDLLNAVNIVASINPDAPKRILLMSHWDSRPWADHDSVPANKSKAVTGANDGASGVGVLMEIARIIANDSMKIGVDILLFDAEDYGAPSDYKGDSEDSWCLGSQYWSKTPHTPGYRAQFGILLDMVGAADAKFYKEQVSMYYAPQVVDRIWAKASELGFSKYFINKPSGGVTDDHLYVNEIAGIPSVDIIHQNAESDSGFGDFWHTVNDDMSVINKETLMAVGTTLLHIIYEENER